MKVVYEFVVCLFSVCDVWKWIWFEEDGGVLRGVGVILGGKDRGR